MSGEMKMQTNKIHDVGKKDQCEVFTVYNRSGTRRSKSKFFFAKKLLTLGQWNGSLRGQAHIRCDMFELFRWFSIIPTIRQRTTQPLSHWGFCGRILIFYQLQLHDDDDEMKNGKLEKNADFLVVKIRKSTNDTRQARIYYLSPKNVHFTGFLKA